MYRHPSPAQSTTSLSDNDIDDDPNESTFFPSEKALAVSSARWIHKRQDSTPPPPENHSAINDLPAEVLIQILKHLHSPRDVMSAMLVCKAWCECSVELLWHKPSIYKLPALSRMLKAMGNPNQTFTYARFIRRLNFLFLAEHITDGVLARMARCERLERLTLALCTNISDQPLRDVLSSCHNLVALDITNISSTSDDTIVALAHSASNLQGINLSGCKRVTDKGVYALAYNCPMLRRVKLSGLESVSDGPVSALASHCPLLLEIDLHQCKLITDISIRDLWMKSMHMREMRLSQCTLLTDAAFPAALTPERTAAQIAADAFPTSTARDNDELPPLITDRVYDHLRMVDLTACANITDAGVQGIVSHSPKLRNLVLSKCTLLTDSSVEAICSLGKHLHYLHMGHASNITDNSVRSLARCCTRLRYVDFANCSLLTDMSVFELAALPKLRRIGLVRVSNLTDEAVYTLASRYNTLERIHLSYCEHISVRAVHCLVQKLQKLTHLSLTGIPSFRKRELQQFCRPPPPEFNQSQRSAFCVYSGNGVQQLRNYLSEYFNVPNGDTTEDETDEEDEFERFGPHHSDIDVGPLYSDDASVQASLSSISTVRAYPRSILTPTTNMPLEQVFRQNAQITPSSTPSLVSPPGPATAAGSSTSVVQPVQGGRPFGQAPLIESPSSPAPSDAASNRSTGTNQSSGAFFRSYQDVSSTRSNGALTPDLNFAEIGYGRGAYTRRGYDSDVHGSSTQSITQTMSASTTVTAPAPGVYALSSPSAAAIVEPERTPRQADGFTHWINAQRQAGVGIVGAEMTPQPTRRELQESVQQALEPVVAAEGRGRSVKRSIRNTINVAEHFAGSLFGRGGGGKDNGGGATGPSGSGPSGATLRS